MEEKNQLLEEEDSRPSYPRLRPSLRTLAILVFILVICCAVLITLSQLRIPVSPELPSDPVSLFQVYLRINTAHPVYDATPVAEFFGSIAQKWGFVFDMLVFSSGKPIILMKIPGKEPTLPAVLFNGHYDVVAVTSGWSVDPFGGVIKNETIYGRGAQDMKSVTIQVLEALRRVRDNVTSKGEQLLRTVYISVVPNEEIGGMDVLEWINTKRFEELNVGLVFDEGLATESDVYQVFYGERRSLSLQVFADGITTHSSFLVENTAATKLTAFLTSMNSFRQRELVRFKDENLTLGEVSTVNVNMLLGGIFSSDYTAYQGNSIPPLMKAGVNIRLPPLLDLQNFTTQLFTWCADAMVQCNLTGDFSQKKLSPVNSTDPYWQAVEKTFVELGLEMTPVIFQAGTDGDKFRRLLNLPVYGFSPMIRTPLLLHEIDESLGVNTFLNGIRVFEQLISNVANVPQF